MKNQYNLLKTALIAGLLMFQLPQDADARGFKDHLGQGAKGKPVSSNPNARVAMVPSLHQNSTIYLPNPMGTGWTLMGYGRYTYDAQGNETSRIMEDASNLPIFKDSTLYDAQGNETFYANYQWQGTGWALSWGSQSVRTYNTAGKQTEAIHQFYNNGVWENSYREVTNYNTAGNPTDEISYDWQNNMWVPEGKMSFTYGATGNTPTELLFQEYNMGVWENSEKYHSLTWHNFAKFEPTAYEGQEWDGNTWVNIVKGNIVYDALGGSVGVEQYWDNGMWVNAYRNSETYDAKMNFTNSKEEMWQNNAWVVDFESAHVLTYNAQDQVTERIYRDWDRMTNMMKDNMKEVYSNFKVLSVAKNLPSLQVKVYPNPTTDYVQVQVEGTEAATAILTDLTGRVVLSKQFAAGANQQLNLSGLAKGTYVLKLETKKGMSIQKIVKQ